MSIEFTVKRSHQDTRNCGLYRCPNIQMTPYLCTYVVKYECVYEYAVIISNYTYTQNYGLYHTSCMATIVSSTYLHVHKYVILSRYLYGGTCTQMFIGWGDLMRQSNEALVPRCQAIRNRVSITIPGKLKKLSWLSFIHLISIPLRIEILEAHSGGLNFYFFSMYTSLWCIPSLWYQKHDIRKTLA